MRFTDDDFEEAVGFQEVVGDGAGSCGEDFGAEFGPKGGRVPLKLTCRTNVN